jgi:exodeoxyribonuclease VIII
MARVKNEILQISDREYFSDPSLGRSDVWKYHLSPPLYKASVVDRSIAGASSSSMNFGSLVHSMILEPEFFDNKYAVSLEKSKRTKAYKEEQEEALEAGKILVMSEDVEKASMLRASALSCGMFKEMLQCSGAIAEGAVFFDFQGIPGTTDPIEAKAKFDLLNGQVLWDVKTSQSADPEEFRRSITKYGYHWQDFWYREALASAGYDIGEFYFLVLSVNEPYEHSVVALDDIYADLAEKQIDDALGGICSGNFESRWKGRVNVLSPKPWETKDLKPQKQERAKVCGWCESKYPRLKEAVCEQCGISLCSHDCLEIHAC